MVGNFLVPSLVAFSGLVGGGVGQEGVADGFPAGSGVSEVADDEGGFLVCVLGGTDGLVLGAGVLGAAVGDAGVAQVAGTAWSTGGLW